MQGYPVTVGRYEILRPLAEGGFGQVFLARMAGAAGFHRTVALKRIRSEYTSSAEFVRDFIKEARIGGYLNHHHVVQVLGFEEIDGNYLLVMEYIDGIGLDLVVETAFESDKPIPAGAIAEIIAQAAGGLQYIHTLRDPDEGAPLQLIHRDIKPSNLLISRSGLVKISDFGIVRANMDAGKRTQAGMIKGTLAYLSPEQARGEPLDHRSDLYSLGAILYELLTLERLWTENSPWILLGKLGNNDIEDRMALLPPRAEPFMPLLNGLLTAEPNSRFASAADVADVAREIQQKLGSPDSTLARLAERWLVTRAATSENTTPAIVAPLLFDAKSSPDRDPTAWIPDGRATIDFEASLKGLVKQENAESATIVAGQRGQSSREVAATRLVSLPASPNSSPAKATNGPSDAKKSPIGVIVLVAVGAMALTIGVFSLTRAPQSPTTPDNVSSISLPQPDPAPLDPTKVPTAAGSTSLDSHNDAAGAIGRPVESPAPDKSSAAASRSAAGRRLEIASKSTSPADPSTASRLDTPGSPELGPAPAGHTERDAAATSGSVTKTTNPLPVLPISTGKLEVTSIPSAQIFIDDSAVGESPLRGMELSPGKYRVRLSRPDLQFQKSLEIDVRSGTTVRVMCQSDGCDTTYR